MIRPAMLLATALLAAPLLAATAAEAHTRVQVQLGLGPVIADPPFYGRIRIGTPLPVRVAPSGWHYHDGRFCRIEDRHRYHRDHHWHYDHR